MCCQLRDIWEEKSRRHQMRLRFTRLISKGSFPGANCGLNVILYKLLAVHFT